MSRGLLRRVASTAGTAALVLASASSAGAAIPGQPPVPLPPPPVSTTTSTTTPAPVKASVRLYLRDVFFVHRQAVTVPGRVVHVGGVVRPYVAGQWVTVRALVGRHLIKSQRLRVKPSRRGNYGHFTAAITTSRTGRVVVYVRHTSTPQMRPFGTGRNYTVLDKNVDFGSTGRFVQLIQQRLAALHFYIPQTGAYDEGTGLAIDAYHRLLHWGTYQTLDDGTISWLLDGLGDFKVRHPYHGSHAEANLGTQLLALVNGSRVYRIYPISSGKPSTPTVLGDFQVYSKVPGYLPDGMYYSNFFYGGYAIHGYDPAPDYPASHGCLRLPIVDAVSVYNWLDYGNWVDVYY
jgi:hypothetical protein